MFQVQDEDLKILFVFERPFGNPGISIDIDVGIGIIIFFFLPFEALIFAFRSFL